jgi:hypothetical protein
MIPAFVVGPYLRATLFPVTIAVPGFGPGGTGDGVSFPTQAGKAQCVHFAARFW